ncbi:MAG: chromosomal replication initiator protein DnaA [Myxococcales bacterium]|nr:chromosomal replication initiator protein DnaA [Myxococcales bacterium]
MQDLWTQAMGQLRTATRRAAADPWLERIELIELIDSTDVEVRLAVPDPHFRDFVEAHYLDDIRACLQALTARPVAVALIVRPPTGFAPPDLATTDPFATALRGLPPDTTSLPEAMFAPEGMSSAEARSSAEAMSSAETTSSMRSGTAPAWGTALGARSHRRGARQPALHGLDLPAQPEPASRPHDPTPDPFDGLAPRQTFDQFIIGQSNQLAATAAQAVADAPGKVFNPLFIYGGVGIGKTHLLHAIGNAARLRDPNLRVRYVPTATFIDDTFTAWRIKDPATKADVRNHYRSGVDLLLVDDIQFLQQRERFQEEFFHVFNALYHAGRQIVITCDRFPSELQDFHDRLRSRFECGLVAELTPPERDLRVAILRRKSIDMGLLLAPDVIYYLADHLRNNVRELEGALLKLAAHARLGNRAPDLAFARSVLGPTLELPSRNVTAEVIQRVTAQHYGLKLTDLKGDKRHRSVVVPRMVAVYLTRKHTGASYPEIGRAFGGRDHSTIIHAFHRVEWLLQTDLAVQTAAAAIETLLGK